MHLDDLKHYFSEPRIERYLLATKGAAEQSIHLYKTNIKVSQAFYPLLNILEVVLRNKIHRILSKHFNDPDWIINEGKDEGFMNKIDIAVKSQEKSRKGKFKKEIKPCTYLKNEVKKVDINSATTNDIISNLTLGFWISFFEEKHCSILKNEPIKIFNSEYPKRSGIYNHLDKIRKFRNRISHNEPICFRKRENIVDFKEALEVHKSITTVLGWIDPKLSNFIKDLDWVQESISTFSYCSDKPPVSHS